MRIRTVSVATACVVMLMLTVGTVALVSLTGGGDRSVATESSTSRVPSPTAAGPTIEASPDAEPTPSERTDEDEEAAADGEQAPDATTPPRSARPESTPSRRPSSSSTSTPRPSPLPTDASPAPSPSPGLLDGLLGPLLGR